jgi:CDP-diacylglycerol--glycerol-3-phosphate 3-phosphatidyltransferase
MNQTPRGLYALKTFYTRMLSPVAALAVRLKLSPDLFTVLGVLGGALAGWSLTTGTGWLVLVGVLVRLAGANLDGAVARARSRESKRGFWVNEIGDRLGDWAMFVPTLWLGLEPIAYACLMVAVALPTTVSLWGAAVHKHQRINGGPFGKTERSLFVVLLGFALPALQAAQPEQLVISPEALLQAWAWAVVAGSLVTAGMRWQRIRVDSRGSRA